MIPNARAYQRVGLSSEAARLLRRLDRRAGCRDRGAGVDGPAGSAAAPRRLQVTALEFEYRLSRQRVPEGRVLIELVNFGEDEHDLALRRVGGTRTYTLPKTLPGRRRTASLRLLPGRYRLWCRLGDHRLRGMYAVPARHEAALQDGVGEPRPRLQRPVAELAVGERDAARASASGSTQRKVPLPPKWPNVRGEFRVPVQCGFFASRSSKPSPQSFGSWRPKPGRTPPRPGNWTRRRLGERLAARRASGASSSRARRSRSSSVPWTPGGRRAAELAPASRAARRRPRAGTRRTASRRAASTWRGQLLEARVRVDPALAGLGDRRRRPRTGSPDACASRWRTVEPGGPAGSSRSTTPSSAATSAASAVDGLRHGRPAELAAPPARATATHALRRDHAGRRVLGAPLVDLPQGVQGRAILARVERRRIAGHAPMEPVVGYSRAVVAGGHVYVSGTAPIPADGSEPPESAYEQARLLPRDHRSARSSEAGAGAGGRRAHADLRRRREPTSTRSAARTARSSARSAPRRPAIVVAAPARPALAGRDRGRRRDRERTTR